MLAGHDSSLPVPRGTRSLAQRKTRRISKRRLPSGVRQVGSEFSEAKTRGKQCGQDLSHVRLTSIRVDRLRGSLSFCAANASVARWRRDARPKFFFKMRPKRCVAARSHFRDGPTRSGHGGDLHQIVLRAPGALSSAPHPQARANVFGDHSGASHPRHAPTEEKSLFGRECRRFRSSAGPSVECCDRDEKS